MSFALSSLRERVSSSPLRSLCVIFLLTLSGCAEWYAESADEEVAELLDEETDRVLGGREDWVERPGSPPVEADAAPVGSQAAFDLDLASSLALAVVQNRSVLSRTEALYQQGLSFTLTRFRFGPQFAAGVSFLWGQSEDQDATWSGQIPSVSASQLLPTGGTLGVSSSLSLGGAESANTVYSSRVDVSLSQPILRGAGYEASHEALTQGERELVYAIRDFEIFRETFSITVAQSYYDLVSQRRTLANQERSHEEAIYDRRKAQALRLVDRNSNEQVFRARRREIEAEASLIDARAAYARALDEFKILLGLPTSARIALAHGEPPYRDVRIDADQAVAAARHNRLDLLTERERLEDTERAVRLARNGLLPDLSLDLSFGLGGSDKQVVHAGPDEWSFTGGLSLGVPIQRKAERNTYRSALIALDQARRQFDLRLDQLELEIRDQLRQLTSTEQQIALQVDQIKQEKKAVIVTEIRYASGDLDNRDLLEARQALIDAENALIRLKTSHFVRRLSLMRDLGLLFVGKKGMWR